MKKILITGSNGQLGIALNRLYVSQKEVKIINTDVEDLDITDIEAVEKIVNKIKPEFIINCAAYTRVDECETNEETVYRINALGPRNLSIISKKYNCTLVHISTDYVFDGNNKIPYTEDDKPNPKSIYGKTKLEGEREVINNCDKYFIVRTSWLYGKGNNFIRTMIKLLSSKEKVSVVRDQIGSPTCADDLAVAIEALINTENYGVYHATGSGECSWFDLAKLVYDTIGSKTKLIPVNTEEYPSKVVRPKYSVLSNKKLNMITGIKMPEWEKSAKKYIEEEVGKMKNYKVLVTGANGYLGRHVVKSLLDLGYYVIASDFSYEGVDKRAELSKVEIFSGSENIYEELGKPDAVIHLAWRNGFIHNSDTHITDLPNHFIFIKNLINGGLKNISVMGTMHEVGYWEGAIDENTPTNPSSLYGIAKNTLRQLMPIVTADKDVKVKWLRAYYIMGDDLKNNSIFSKIVQKANEGAKTFPLNSGKNKYDFINVKTLAEQIAKAAVQTEVDGVINCCTGKPISLGEKVEEFIKEKGFDIELQYGVFPDRPYDSPAIWGNPDKINTILSNYKD